ncbi:unnamed protein product [Effrenium voratum]|nr:unnamed protein product [Effrenium voratum]
MGTWEQKPLPGDASVTGDQPCLGRIPAITGQLLACMASEQVEHQFDVKGNEAAAGQMLLLLQVHERGQGDCNVSVWQGQGFESEYTASLGNLSKCQPFFKAWTAEMGSASSSWISWWSSAPGIVCQFIIVILILAVLCWCFRDYCEARGFCDEEELQAKASAGWHAPYKAPAKRWTSRLLPVPEPVKESSESETEQAPILEVEEPKPRPKPLHSFQVRQDLHLSAPQTRHESLFPPGTAPP